jgi:hypothetical protein
MSWFQSLVDDFHLNLHLSTELELGCSNDSVFHFLEMFQRAYPRMHKFDAHDTPDWVRLLEEDREGPRFRWLSVEKSRIGAGFSNPDSLGEAYELHRRALQLAPTALGISLLNLRTIDVMYAFDLTYEGNHDEIVARVFAPPSFERLLENSESSIVNFEPNITFAVDESNDIQCRLSVETQSSSGIHLQGHRSEENQITVLFTVRRYWSAQHQDLIEVYQQLTAIGEKFVENQVVPNIVKPLAEVIASL